MAINIVQRSSICGPFSHLSPAQQRAVVLLASGQSGRKTAKQVGVTPECISHWRRQSSFSNALNLLRNEVLEGARDALRGLAGKAIQTLDETLSSNNATLRLRAATVILQLLQKEALNESSPGRPAYSEPEPQEFETVEFHIEEQERMRELGSALLKFAMKKIASD